MMYSMHELPPADNLAKIIIQRSRDAGGKMSLFIFARYDTGLIIGAVNQQQAQFGIGNGMQAWWFLTPDQGVEHLKMCCRDYLDRFDVDFLVEDSSEIFMPGQSNPADLALPRRRH